MASIQNVKVGPYTYYRIVESRRVNGKPRPIPVLHLGTADQLLERLLAQSEPQLKVRSYQHGDVAALNWHHVAARRHQPGCLAVFKTRLGELG